MVAVAPAIDRRTSPATISTVAFTALEALEVTDPSTPGDPDTEPTVVEPAAIWAAPRRGIEVVVDLQRPVTHEKIGTLRTAVARSWDEDVESIPKAESEASSWDPLWEAVAATTATFRGRDVYGIDAKDLEVLIWVDGAADWTGVLRQPVDVGSGRIKLPAAGPEVLYRERHLGRVEQFDHLGGWGNFEAYPIGSTPPGLTLVPNPGQSITAEVVAGGVRGTRSLKVTGWGWVESPKVALPGQAEVGRTAEGSAFGRFHADVPVGAPVVQTLTQVVGAGSPTNLAETVRKQGLRATNDTGWTVDPVTSGATMSLSTDLHLTWMRMAGHGDPVYYDLARLQQGVQSGSLNEQPYSWYAHRFLGDVQNEALGGASWGIRRRIVSESVGSAQIQVSHNTQPRFDEVLALVTDVVDGCAIWVDPSWTAQIMARRGQVRTDVALTPDNVLDCRWASDPGAEIDDLIVDTGRGSATSLVTSQWSSPLVEGRHRITKIVRVPSEWPLNRADAYGEQQHAQASLQNMTATVRVRWAYGRRIGCGDSLLCALVDGNLMSVGVRRVLNRRMLPLEGAVELTVGNAA